VEVSKCDSKFRGSAKFLLPFKKLKTKALGRPQNVSNSAKIRPAVL
jgi:hypothetical protein